MKTINTPDSVVSGEIIKGFTNLNLAIQLAEKIRTRLEPDNIWGMSDVRAILVNSLNELTMIERANSTTLP